MRKCLGLLAEHYSSVQIIATRLEPNGSTSLDLIGTGDYYARLGACNAFMQRAEGDHSGELIAHHIKASEGE